MFNLTTQQHIEDFTRGCCFFATGGGGDPLFGQKMLREVLDAGKQINIIDVSELKEDAWTVCPYLMGAAPGPEVVALQQEKEKYGLTQEVILNMPMAAAQLLLKQQQVRLDAVIPLELGAAATASAVATAAMLDVPTVDGDFEGRALPEIAQMLPALNNYNLFPLASCDAYGNQIIIEKAINQQMTERMGKLIATASFSLVGQATLLMRLKHLKPVLLPQTLSKALAVGAALRQARETNSIQSIIELTQAKILFRGRVVKRQAEIKDGYYVGDIYIEGADSFKGDQLKIWFKNENILSWLNGNPYIACPDLITMIDQSDFEPVINGKLLEGTEVIVFGLQAPEAFRTSAALKVLEPKHFGFDFQAKTL